MTRVLDMTGLEHGTNQPGNEFLVANAVLFTLRLLAARDRQDLLEDFVSHGFDRCTAQDLACVDIHVILHSLKHWGVCRDLDRGYRLAAIAAASPGCENNDVSATGDHAGDAARVEAGRIHDDKTTLR